MKRFMLPDPPDAAGMIRLTGKDYHYLVRVRRSIPGTLFKALLPDGKEVQVRVCSVDGACLLGSCCTPDAPESGAAWPARKSEDSPVRNSLPPILLFQALPKGAKMDLILRQATEGGITEIRPFVSGYSVPRIKPGQGDAKTRRWERIIKEARQQSGSDIATSIRAPCTVAALMEYWETLKSRYPQALGILLHQPPLEKGGLHDYLSTIPELVALAVGPEGGFAAGEVSQFLAAGFKPVGFGATVLRTETAALYGAAAIRIILLESASWMPKIPQHENESAC
ncbi:MAG: 16S rRNA (uracil(1498)-N(3))-methyltransferase [Treponema sp.]|jgi:16S rRNA (uracil1498-N3)-methyltransferase|nr:16S rRNA (uracil(1498)-N(3))-methyltransferase [Treponema sp.]